VASRQHFTYLRPAVDEKVIITRLRRAWAHGDDPSTPLDETDCAGGDEAVAAVEIEMK